MRMFRIRYRKTTDDLYISTSTLVSIDNVKYKVYLYKQQQRYEIVATVDDIIVASGSHVSYQLLLRHMRASLRALGVPLKKERKTTKFVKKTEQEEIDILERIQ